MQYLISTFSFHCLTLTFCRRIHASAPTHINPTLLNPQNENFCFGAVFPFLMRKRMNENKVWTDSQDYGADEIYPIHLP